MNFVTCHYAEGAKFQAFVPAVRSQFQHQGIDDVRIYGYTDIDEEFKRRHKSAWDNPRAPIRGGVVTPIPNDGCAIWKPYFILKTLNTMVDGDILIYMDTEERLSGAPRLKEYVINRVCENKGFATMNLPWTNARWTRRDTFILMNADSPEYWYAKNVESGFIGMVKNQAALEFVGSWINYIGDPRVSGSLVPNQFGENFPEFEDHRCDQSIFSILLRKFGAQRDDVGAGMGAYGMGHWMNEAAQF